MTHNDEVDARDRAGATPGILKLAEALQAASLLGVEHHSDLDGNRNVAPVYLHQATTISTQSEIRQAVRDALEGI